MSFHQFPQAAFIEPDKHSVVVPPATSGGVEGWMEGLDLEGWRGGWVDGGVRGGGVERWMKGWRG